MLIIPFEDHSSTHSFNKYRILNTSEPLVPSLSSFFSYSSYMFLWGITSSPFPLNLLGSVGVISILSHDPQLVHSISYPFGHKDWFKDGTDPKTGPWDSTLDFIGNTGKERELFPLGWLD